MKTEQELFEIIKLQASFDDLAELINLTLSFLDEDKKKLMVVYLKRLVKKDN